MSVQFFPTTLRVCCCDADTTLISTVVAVVRGNPWKGERRLKRSQQIRHYRRRDDTYFWHWRDNKVVPI